MQVPGAPSLLIPMPVPPATPRPKTHVQEALKVPLALTDEVRVQTAKPLLDRHRGQKYARGIPSQVLVERVKLPVPPVDAPRLSLAAHQENVLRVVLDKLIARHLDVHPD